MALTTDQIAAAINAAGFAGEAELTLMFKVSRLIVQQQVMSRQIAARRSAHQAAGQVTESQIQALQSQVNTLEQTIVTLTSNE